MINLAPKYLALVKTILQQHIPNKTVWLFGSRATKHCKPYSDIDLAIITNTPIDIDIITRLSLAFSNSDLPYKVDLVDWPSIDDDFKKIIKEKYAVVQRGYTV